MHADLAATTMLAKVEPPPVLADLVAFLVPTWAGQHLARFSFYRRGQRRQRPQLRDERHHGQFPRIGSWYRLGNHVRQHGEEASDEVRVRHDLIDCQRGGLVAHRRRAVGPRRLDRLDLNG